MGFKRRASYVEEGWIPKHEMSVEQMRLNAMCAQNPSQEILIFNEHELEEGVKFRRVRVTTEVVVEEIDPPPKAE